MKKLKELYPSTKSDIEINDISINSKECHEGSLFVCTMGVKADRHDFIDDAIKNGASAIVVSRDGIKKDVPVIKVENTNQELPKLCGKFYDYPDKKMTLIGVTGTDGKTSTTTIIQTLLGKDKCGYIGTNGVSFKEETEDNPNTTPDVHLLYKFFNDFVEAGCKYAAMEASSEAFFRGRLTELEFDIATFTNITWEHVNIHGTFENYIDSKMNLFRQTKKDGYCILNKDEEHYAICKKNSNGHVLSYGEDKSCDLQIVKYTLDPHHTLITFKYKNKLYDIDSPLLGDFNVSNLAAGILSVLALGKTMEEIIPKIKNIKVDGRLELLDTKTPYYVMVDYAHTPNGIARLLNFVHTLDIKRSIVVIGSAGERDYKKRPVMGKTIMDNASYAIFTYEDPRSEEPIDIINMLVADIKDNPNYEIVVDRRDAIRRAIDIAEPNDMVLILGKGNETYQKLKHETIYFNDIEEAYEAVKLRKERESK